MGEIGTLLVFTKWVLPVALGLALLKIVLLSPEIASLERTGFWQFGPEGKTYVAKIVGDAYFLTCLASIGIVWLAKPKWHGAVGHGLLMLLVVGPFLVPGVYLLMKAGRDRAIRFAVSCGFAAWWLFQVSPAV